MKLWIKWDCVDFLLCLTAFVGMAAVTGCSTIKPHVDSNFDFARIRKVYVEPATVSAVPNTDELRSEIGKQFTTAVREQLRADGRFMVVENAGNADAVFRADVNEYWKGEWYVTFALVGYTPHGPRAHSRVGARLSLFTDDREVWSVSDKHEQIVGANWLFGAFARHPSSLAPELIRNVLVTIPTYKSPNK